MADNWEGISYSEDPKIPGIDKQKKEKKKQ